MNIPQKFHLLKAKASLCKLENKYAQQFCKYWKINESDFIQLIQNIDIDEISQNIQVNVDKGEPAFPIHVSSLSTDELAIFSILDNVAQQYSTSVYEAPANSFIFSSDFLDESPLLYSHMETNNNVIKNPFQYIPRSHSDMENTRQCKSEAHNKALKELERRQGSKKKHCCITM